LKVLYIFDSFINKFSGAIVICECASYWMPALQANLAWFHNPSNMHLSAFQKQILDTKKAP